MMDLEQKLEARDQNLQEGGGKDGKTVYSLVIVVFNWDLFRSERRSCCF
jgi:hypothetical protein